MNTLIPWIILVVGLLGILQIIDVMVRDIYYFDNHTHKLVWFLVIVVGNIIGAIWYYRWKRIVLEDYYENELSKIQRTNDNQG